MNPEQQAREQIDAALEQCGWTLQYYKSLDLSASRGIALREVPLKSGRCDYLLLVDRKPVGIVEAKPEGTTLSGVAEQDRIVAEVERRLSVVDELEATVTANLQRAARLRQAILQQAINGSILNENNI